MLVHVGDVLGQTQVGVSVRLVLDQPQQVKTGQQGGRQLDVLLDALARVVAAIGGVGGRQDGATGVQRCHDASLGEEEEEGEGESNDHEDAEDEVVEMQPGEILVTLAMEMVCCSITSWMAVRSASAILSNSSMQQTPWSASTKAPPSRVISPVRGSCITAAVRPTPDEPRPVVYWPGWQRDEAFEENYRKSSS